jgi:hypothetical protein
VAFPPSIKEEALVRSRRCCCVCQRFAGLYTNVHHIVQEADDGENDISNAIVLCLECHGQAGHYNDRHPIGDKYKPSELRRHRDKWWAWCEKNHTAPLPHDPIAVAPNAIAVMGDGWASVIPLKINNNATSVYYHVWIKVGVGTAGLGAEEVALEDFQSPDLLSAPIAGLRVSADALVLYGTDGSGHEALYLVIACIDPGATLAFTLTTKATEQADPLPMPIMLLAFSPELSRPLVLQQQDQIAFGFTPPEPFIVKGIRVKVLLSSTK